MNIAFFNFFFLYLVISQVLTGSFPDRASTLNIPSVQLGKLFRAYLYISYQNHALNNAYLYVFCLDSLTFRYRDPCEISGLGPIT